jgi:hypothetical protein
VKKGILPIIKDFFYGTAPRVAEHSSYILENDFSKFFNGLYLGDDFKRKSLTYLVETGYVSNPIIFGVINRIINAQKNLNLIPYWNGKPYVKYLSKPYPVDFSYALFQLITTGTVVFWKRDIVGFGEQIEVLNTLNLIETNDRGNLKYSYDLKNNKYIIIPEDELTFIGFIDISSSFNTNLGVSPLQASIMPLEALKSMYQMDNSLLKNKGIEGLLSNDNTMIPSTIEADEIDFALGRKLKGFGKYGSVAYTNANIKYTQLGRTVKEMALWDGYKIKVKDICIALGVPPSLAGDSDTSTYANYEMATKSLYTDCVIALTEKIFNDSKVKRLFGFETYIDTSRVDCLQDDQLLRVNKNKELTNSILKLNTEVKNGNITKDIAVNILVSEWGYDEQEAIKLIIEQPIITINNSTLNNQL